MKKRLLINTSIIVITLIYAFVLILTNVGVKKAIVAFESGSYAQTYAEKEKLVRYELADSELKYFNMRYEEFDYDYEKDGVSIKGYRGKSEELIIPAVIDGEIVRKIGNGFFEHAACVKKIYICDFIDTIEDEPKDGVTICCSEDSLIYQKEVLRKEEYERQKELFDLEASNGLNESEKIGEETFWEIQLVADSTYVDYFLGKLDFDYNSRESGIEIVRYTGEDDLVIIPSYINGLPVTKVSIDMVGGEIFVIPSTVTDISGKTTSILMTVAFIIEMFFTIVAIILFFIMINIVIPKKNKAEEYFASATQTTYSYAYVIAQLLFSIIVLYSNKVEYYYAFIISSAILAIYVLAFSLATRGKQHLETTNRNISEKTARFKRIRTSINTLEVRANNDIIKTEMRKLMDEMRFSDPSGVEASYDIEEKICDEVDKLKDAIDKQDAESVKKICIEISNLLKERNVIVKANK